MADFVNQDIFGRRALNYGGSFAADSTCISLDLKCTMPDDTTFYMPGLLTQQLSVQYQQQITRLYEVGTQKTYFIAGRPQGTATLARILGPGTIASEFYSCLGDVCNAFVNDLCFCVSSGCLNNENDVEGPQDCNNEPENIFSSISLCLKNVVLQSMGISVQAQDMIINEQLSIFFNSLMAQSSSDPCVCDDNCEITCECFS